MEFKESDWYSLILEVAFRKPKVLDFCDKSQKIAKSMKNNSKTPDGRPIVNPHPRSLIGVPWVGCMGSGGGDGGGGVYVV